MGLPTLAIATAVAARGNRIAVTDIDLDAAREAGAPIGWSDLAAATRLWPGAEPGKGPGRGL